jgi:hypothetical protein
MHTTTTEACLNCGDLLSGPYCAGCGQKTPHIDLTLREFLHDATQELTQLEGKVPATLKALFLEPGRLTLDFLAGRRARWLSPLRLYLICSLAYFLSQPLAEAITHRSAKELAKITVTTADGRTTLTPEGRAEIEASPPGRLFGPERMERAVANMDKFNRAIESATSKAMFVLLPFFALLTNLAWRRKVPRYPAHLYLALHLHSAWFGALTLATLVSIPFESTSVVIGIGFVSIAYIVGYGLVAVRRVFGDSWMRTIAKAIAIGVAYSALQFAMSIALLAYAIAMM